MVDVVIIDDEKDVRESASQWLNLSGLNVKTYGSGAEALKFISSNFEGVVLSDVRMPGIDGFKLKEKIHELDSDIPIILFTGHGDITMAVSAIRDGAYDFIEKPFEPQRMLETIFRGIEKRSLVLENRALKKELRESRESKVKILGSSKKIKELRLEIENIAPTSANILISGETGTGKELIARSIHDFSGFKKDKFIAINCAAIPATMAESELFGHCCGAFTNATTDRVGKLEAASGGTLFLDELNSMPIEIQSKMLRALECKEITPLGSNSPRPIDVRVISAMNVAPHEAVEAGDLRGDLLFRLNTFELIAPPLKERVDDISLLFSHFAEKASKKWERPLSPLDSGSLSLLKSHNWTGNVRELKNIAERYVLSVYEPAQRIARLLGKGEEICQLSLKKQVMEFEKKLIQDSLLFHNWNIKAVLEELMIPRRTLNEKMVKFSIKRN